MVVRRRRAKIEATLVFVDEPLLLTLISGRSRLIAVAVPSETIEERRFFAITVSPVDWTRYLAGTVDLRYLYVYPSTVNVYIFDYCKSRDGFVQMTPFEGDIPESYIPSHKFFSRHHTEEYEAPEKATGRETLYIDGEWELPDFGQFQQKFSDIYAYLKSESAIQSELESPVFKRKIVDAFTSKPFQGGFSYVHFFRELNDNIPSHDQINLRGVRYNSPGTVEISGLADVFVGVRDIVENYIENRVAIKKLYNTQHKYLSDGKYLKMSGEQYSAGTFSDDVINKMSRDLCGALRAPDFVTVDELTRGNALVTAKIVLAFCRRVADAALYFSQGRIAYKEDS